MKTETEKQQEKKGLIGFGIFLVMVVLICIWKLTMEYIGM